MPKNIIIHDKYGYRVCNVCNEEEIEMSSTRGACTPCVENRIEDGLIPFFKNAKPWDIDIWDDRIVFDTNGWLIKKKEK